MQYNLKGVNKQIVEINYTRNDYIEKAILIVNPQKSKQGDYLLRKKAFDYMETLGVKKSAKRKARLQSVVRSCCLLLSGAGFTLLLMHLLR